jgi:hypothetical protein
MLTALPLKYPTTPSFEYIFRHTSASDKLPYPGVQHYRKILIRSSGAVAVRDMAPEIPPVTRCIYFSLSNIETEIRIGIGTMY